MTKELKTRVRTLKSTHQITSAMKIVAATTFNRLKQQTAGLFDFLDSLLDLSNQIKTDEKKSGNKRLLIVIGSDRGLCGGYNAAVRKKASQYLKDFPDTEVIFIGSKSVLKDKSAIISDKIQNLQNWEILFDRLSPLWEQCSVIDIVYTVFHTLYDQQVVITPTCQQDAVDGKEPIILDETTVNIQPIIYTAKVMRAIIHAQLCEFSSRMLSMDNATQNAEEMIETLYLTINKIRQAMITKELSETVAGSM